MFTSSWGGDAFRKHLPKSSLRHSPLRKGKNGFGRAVSRILSALLRGERIICLGSRYPESVPLSRDLERAAPGFPIWPCTRWGFPCRVACASRGGLLHHLFTLTTPQLVRAKAGGLIF